jgi:hypothetical protein
MAGLLQHESLHARSAAPAVGCWLQLTCTMLLLLLSAMLL